MLAVALFALAGRGTSDTKPAEKETARIQKLLTDHVVQTGALKKPMPLSEFLTALEGLLPKGSKLSLRVDAEARLSERVGDGYAESSLAE